MYVSTEVATAKHVYECLKAGIDVLWIGARTTANPFAVQEIADALKGVDIPILIKNPVNPDLELWIGAFERINNAGLKQLIKRFTVTCLNGISLSNCAAAFPNCLFSVTPAISVASASW